VYADSENNVKSYKLLDKLYIMTQKQFKAVVEINDIANELEKLRKDSNNPLQNYNDVENTIMINKFLVGISNVVSGLRLVLTYEKLIV
jgi:cellulose biosynthesis protein BcsQ